MNTPNHQVTADPLTLHPLANRFKMSWHDPAFSTLDGRAITYGELWTTARFQAKNWRDEGLKAGDIVAFRLENSYRLPCLYLACAMANLIACPVVPTLAERTVQQNLDDLRPARFIDGEIDLPIQPADQNASMQLDGRLPFLIMFSSGSTGKNKAICHNLNSVTGSADAFGRLSDFSSKTRLYHVLPMTYMAGFLNAMFAVFTQGGQVIEGPQFRMTSVADFWRHALSTNANALSLIPPIAAAACRLTRNQAVIDRVASQFSTAQCTSQSIPMDLRRRFFDKFSLPLQDCYGMTELGGALSLQSTADALGLNNRTHPMPEITLEIRDEGQLWVKSPFSMMGYLIDGELQRIDDERGFIDTGDLAVMTEGTLEITGRIKDIIIRGGINTSPAHIESVMSQINGVEEVAIVGRPHAFWGEEIVACLIGDAGEAEIMAFCREHLAQHETPDRLVYMDSFPRSFIGKLLKRELAQQLEHL